MTIDECVTPMNTPSFPTFNVRNKVVMIKQANILEVIQLKQGFRTLPFFFVASCGNSDHLLVFDYQHLSWLVR